MTHKLLAVLAGALFVVGLLVGLVPTSAYGVNCGSAFAPSDDPDAADFLDTFGGNQPRAGTLGGISAACDDKLSDRQLIAIVLLVAGGAAGTGTLISWPTGRLAGPSTWQRLTGQDPTSGAGSDESRNRDTPR